MTSWSIVWIDITQRKPQRGCLIEPIKVLALLHTALSRAPRRGAIPRLRHELFVRLGVIRMYRFNRHYTETRKHTRVYTRVQTYFYCRRPPIDRIPVICGRPGQPRGTRAFSSLVPELSAALWSIGTKLYL